MKKVSLILAALALVLGISQCKKQEDPMGKLVTQKVTFTTSFGDGSKLNPGEAGGSLNPKWVVGDKIIVSDGVTTPASELECKKIENGGTAGVFEGTITCQENANLTFSYNPIDYLNQDGSLQIYLKGTSGYQESGNYVVNMTMPCAILKLDLAELATADGADVSVTIGGNEVAIVKGVKTSASQVYLLLPLTATEPTTTTLTFSNETTIITKPYTLAPNGFYTAGGNGGYAPVEPTFSVSETTTVEFAPGNLWYGKADGESTAAFHFEANQWSTTPASSGTWDPSHVSHFFWSKTASVAYASSHSDSGASTNDVFFTNDPENETKPNENFQVAGETAGTWRTLSKAEWDYLLDRSDGSLKAWVTLTDLSVSGLVILPDGSTVTASEVTTKDLVASSGAVFLPAAGSRDDTGVYNVGSGFYYWSSTPHKTLDGDAYYVLFDEDFVFTDCDYRGRGCAVRLVR